LKKIFFISLAVILALSIGLIGCEGEGEGEEPFVPETGTWIGDVVFSVNNDYGSVISQMAAGLLDMYGLPIADPTSYEVIMDTPEINSELNYGGYRELRFNTYRDQDGDPESPPYSGNYTDDEGKLNPFANPAIREAMNLLIDRNYIYQEILGELGAPKWTCLGTAFPDHARYYDDIIGPIETAYAYDFDAAKAVFDTEMPAMGATWNSGEELWYFDGSPVEITCLIRADLPPNPEQGVYVATQIEALGFDVVQLILPGSEASSYWLAEAPTRNGDWHVYTGGWSSPVIPRDSADVPSQMYTDIVMPFFVFSILGDQLVEDGFTNFRDGCVDLRARNFASMAERETLFDTVLNDAMEWSNCIWTVDIAGANIYAADVETAVDLAGGIGDPAWVHTTHAINTSTGDPVWRDQLEVACPNLLVEPYNPVAGSSFTYDMFIARRALGDTPALPDPRDGHYWPLRVESATVDYYEDLPITNEMSWVTLTSSADKIAVPGDCWYTWNATTEEWITTAEYKAANPSWDDTANVKVVVTYPDDLFDIPLHDGSTLSLADIMMAMIMHYDRGMPESTVYDSSWVEELSAFLSMHKGHRIISVDPLTIESYTDKWYMDAEWNVVDQIDWFPTYGVYDWTGFWHMISAGWLLEAETKPSGAEALPRLAWSKDKADDLLVDQMDYTKGDTLDALADAVAYAKANSFMPYEDAISAVYSDFGLTGLAAEITERWTNLEGFAADVGHYWVGNGPYYLKSVDAVAKVVVLERFEDYPDEAGRFFFFLDPLP
jgi:peptide/nickel transport system substrate-binding protein